MKIELTGKTAIVTGSSAGLGWGSAVALAAAGATVVLTGRYGEKLQAARDRILQAVPGASVRSHVADLTTAAGCSSLVEAEPSCDILVNSLAKNWTPKNFFDTPDEEWDTSFQASVMPGVRCTRGYLRQMMDRGWGRVLFLSSVEAVIATPDSLDYAFTRAAVLSLSRGLAKIAGDSGVTVNAVLIGVTMTEGTETVLRAMLPSPDTDLYTFGATAVKQRYPTSVDGRVHTVEEVTNLVVYLCSEFSSATTGSTYRADGGILESLV